MNYKIQLLAMLLAMGPSIAQEHEGSQKESANSPYETIVACGIIMAIAIIQACTEPHKALPNLAQKILCAITGTCCTELAHAIKKDSTGSSTIYAKHVEF